MVVNADAEGRFSMDVPANAAHELTVSRIGFAERRLPISPLRAGDVRTIRVELRASDNDIDIVVRESRLDDAGMVREETEQLRRLPSTTGNLEAVLPAIALGLSSGTGGELSSQYNVRGGNYDENLVYVNDFEIYRPQLIRTGQQEGLTFANLDLASSLSFSSGGFESRYGDKLSSVLDVRYKRPDSLAGSASASFLGASAHIEGSSKLGKDGHRRLRYLGGVRYKTTRYLLGSLDTRGEYQPDFVDLQGYVTYDLNEAWQVAALANFNRAIYKFEPTERSTGFGLISLALQLQSAFEGRESDDFLTGMGGLSLTYVPERERNPLYLKFLGSGFHIRETERRDVAGAYSLREVDAGLGSDEFGEAVREISNGVQQRYIRNYLLSNVYNVTHLGGIELQGLAEGLTSSSHFVQWGATLKREEIFDRINEWERLDSAGYSLRYSPDSVLLNLSYKSRNTLEGYRATAFVQDTWTWRREDLFESRLTLGVRGGYWTINGEAYVTPRVQWLVKPLGGRQDISYRIAGGLYYQPPFYRELRRPNGELNQAILAQKSAHALAGLTWDFSGKNSGRPYRFIAEAYYKHLWDVASYEVDNVRIRYSGLNDATGYVAGLDARINGEFVRGTESWFNLSLLRAREALDGVAHLDGVRNDSTFNSVRDVPRPTDQLFTTSLYFQDYLPNNENFQVNLTATVGSGLPFGLPESNREIRNTYRFAAYRRLDIGFGAQLWRDEWRDRKPRHVLKFSKNAWVSLELFNILGIRNEASNTWIKTILSQQYAIPNYLTGRRVNLRVRVEW